MTTTTKGWNPDHSINLLFGVAIVVVADVCATAFFAKISSRASAYKNTHSSEKKGNYMDDEIFSSKMFQNLSYFWNTKIEFFNK